jgi:hypothetical protein
LSPDRRSTADRLSIGRPPAGPNTLRIAEWMLGLMRAAGIPNRPAAYFGNTLDRFLDASAFEDSTAVSAESDNGAEDRADMMREVLGSSCPPNGSRVSPRSRTRPSPATPETLSSSGSACSYAGSRRTDNRPAARRS